MGFVYPKIHGQVRIPKIHFNIRTILWTFLLAGVILCTASGPPGDTNVKLVSTAGSSGATGNTGGNKIIETEDFIFVTWLGVGRENFEVLINRYEKYSKTWSRPVVVATNLADNHASPALLLDSEQYLHIVFSGHHSPFYYRKSVKPLEIDRWSVTEKVGEELTYPAFTIDCNDNLYLVGRARYSLVKESMNIWTLQYFSKKKGGEWSPAKEILQSNYEKWKAERRKLSAFYGYVAWNQSLRMGPDCQTLHLAFRNWEYLPADLNANYATEKGAGAYFVGYMYSDDGGGSWKAGEKTLELPANPQTVEIIDGERNPPAVGPNFGISDLVINSENNPVLSYIKHFKDHSEVWVSQRTNGQWDNNRIDLQIPGHQFTRPLTLGLGKDDHLLVVATLVDQERYAHHPKIVPGSRLGGIAVDGHYKVNHRFIIDTAAVKHQTIARPSMAYYPLMDKSSYPPFLVTAGKIAANKKDIQRTRVYLVKDPDKSGKSAGRLKNIPLIRLPE